MIQENSTISGYSRWVEMIKERLWPTGMHPISFEDGGGWLANNFFTGGSKSPPPTVLPSTVLFMFHNFKGGLGIVLPYHLLNKFNSNNVLRSLQYSPYSLLQSLLDRAREMTVLDYHSLPCRGNCKVYEHNQNIVLHGSWWVHNPSWRRGNLVTWCESNITCLDLGTAKLKTAIVEPGRKTTTKPYTYLTYSYCWLHAFRLPTAEPIKT